MDILLGDIAKADYYYDDIIVVSETLERYKQTFRTVFQRFRDRNISIGPSKTFVVFPNVTVLGRFVNSFRLSTTRERVAAITKLKFPAIFKDLEYFVGTTGYIRYYIPLYIQRIELLQHRKTMLLKETKRKSKRQA